ncbi:MAG: hypothetical protein AAFX01_00295 [Cyanobacteria bacterium J06638_28]
MVTQSDFVNATRPKIRNAVFIHALSHFKQPMKSWLLVYSETIDYLSMLSMVDMSLCHRAGIVSKP